MSRTLMANVWTAWRNIVTLCSSHPIKFCSWSLLDIDRRLLISRSRSKTPNFEKTSPTVVHKSMMFSFDELDEGFADMFVVVVVVGIFWQESRRSDAVIFQFQERFVVVASLSPCPCFYRIVSYRENSFRCTNRKANLTSLTSIDAGRRILCCSLCYSFFSTINRKREKREKKASVKSLLVILELVSAVFLFLLHGGFSPMLLAYYIAFF